MDVGNIVSLRTYLADPMYDEANVRARVKYLGAHEPCSTVICCQLLVPRWKLEIEAMAAVLRKVIVTPGFTHYPRGWHILLPG